MISLIQAKKDAESESGMAEEAVGGSQLNPAIDEGVPDEGFGGLWKPESLIIISFFVADGPKKMRFEGDVSGEDE